VNLRKIFHAGGEIEDFVPVDLVDPIADAIAGHAKAAEAA
jgi:hypothetical protein